MFFLSHKLLTDFNGEVAGMVAFDQALNNKLSFTSFGLSASSDTVLVHTRSVILGLRKSISGYPGDLSWGCPCTPRDIDNNR